MSTKSCVGVIVGEEMKEKVVDIVRKTDRVIMVKEVLRGKVLNIVSAYGP